MLHKINHTKDNKFAVMANLVDSGFVIKNMQKVGKANGFIIVDSSFENAESILEQLKSDELITSFEVVHETGTEPPKAAKRK